MLKRTFFFAVVAFMTLMLLRGALAVDYRLYYPRQETEPVPQKVQDFIRDRVVSEQRENGFFTVYDPRIERQRRLYVLKFNKGVSKTLVTVEGEEKEYYYSSAIFRDLDNNEQLKVSVYVEIEDDGTMKVVSREIDKVGGKKR
ncbi:MAG: hypothetical protein GF409_05490 [Candidatus Omnitrophica bacterium]|nr:hypothetical protein [Candidatus Omnitrophota bacterium]